VTTTPQRRVEIEVTVNGTSVKRAVAVRQNLADFLREELELTGTHLGCEHGVCGACTVLVDGEVVRGCLMLAVQANGTNVDTIEGLAESKAIAELQAAFVHHNAAQCGFCTAGILLTAHHMLQRRQHPSRAEIREYISGNFCRCTGYQAIVDAIAEVFKRRDGGRV
jgi:carbon-monoxide dehydrogenase small subunit